MYGVVATGGTITDYNIGGTYYRKHVFTSGGTFSVSDVGTGTIDVLIVAGGAGGGSRHAGGGGAGGLLYETDHSVVVNDYTVTVGDGGVGGVYNSTSQSNGDDSIFDSLTAIGGGYGGNIFPERIPQDGGSGGGTEEWSSVVGQGLQPGSTDGGYGNDGGLTAGIGNTGGGGGGGANEVGAAGNLIKGGDGGDGRDYSTFFDNDIGDNGYFAGGGGGCAAYVSEPAGTGGIGGGGDGAINADTADSGTANTGGGGGGSRGNGAGNGGAGGSGIVIIRYIFEMLETIDIISSINTQTDLTSDLV